MQKDYSLDALNRFFVYAIDKGILKAETAKSRKIAANKIFEKITSEEQADLRLVNLDTEADRFANRQGADYLPASLQVYKSRARTALADFVAYVDNPMTFKPGSATRASSKTGGNISTKKHNGGTSGKNSAAPSENAQHTNPIPTNPLQNNHDHLVFPIPIRPGVIVKVSNIPADLSANEAEKIAQVIKALASLG